MTPTPENTDVISIHDAHGRERLSRAGNSEPSLRPRLLFGETSFPLRDGTNVVGRDVDADIHLRGAAISRRHARITLIGARAVLEDLESKNGTFVLGERIVVPTDIHDGDAIRPGNSWLIFRTPERSTNDGDTH